MASSLSNSVLKTMLPATRDSATKGFYFQQTMIRIKDPKRSLEFYTKVLGMSLIGKFDFPSMNFCNYFVGYENAEDMPGVVDSPERRQWTLSRPATLELTHNYGTETQEGQVYHNGNSDPRGFGHIGIAVPDVYEACARFEKLSVPFQKTPDGGKMKGLAFIRDPDDYWIEIIDGKHVF